MSGRIPQDFINNLIERVDICQIIDARVKLKRSGQNFLGLCPFHDEKTPSFSVSQEKQFYHCFSCKNSGTVLTFLMEYEGLDFVAAVESLASIAGVEVPREQLGKAAQARDKKQQQTHKRLFDVLDEASSYFQRMLRQPEQAQAAVDYLKARGLSGLIARDFAIGYAPAGWDGLLKGLEKTPPAVLVEAGLAVTSEKGRTYDRFRDRIMFPIRDVRGRVIAFGGRVMGDEQPKYMNSPELPIFHKGRELYGLYEARRAVRKLNSFLIVEGYMDVVALAQSGIANSVATLGTATSAEHLEKLYRYAGELVCCFDGDRAGRAAAWKALELSLPLLREGRSLKFIFLPDGEDPDSLVRKIGKKEFLNRVSQAMPGIEYLFQRLTEDLDLNAIDGRARLAELGLPMIEQVPDGVLKQLMLQRLADLTQLDVFGSALGRSTMGQDGPDLRRHEHVEDEPYIEYKPSKISKDLLSRLLKYPHFIEGVPVEVREII